jgi:hypothetical protein
MTETLTFPQSAVKTGLSLSGVAHTSGGQFKLYFYATVMHLFSHLISDAGGDEDHSPEEIVFERFPFLSGYISELAAFGLDGMRLDLARQAWQAALLEWEQAAGHPLPLTSLRQAVDLDYDSLTLLLAVGLIDEDARFGPLFAAVQGNPAQHRPTLALLSAWWCDGDGYGEVRGTIRRLQELGLVEVINPEAPRPEWAFQPAGILWDALRGERRTDLASWCRYRPPEDLPLFEELVLPDDIQQSLRTVPALFKGRDIHTLVLRGPQHNGRHTVLGALARTQGRGILEVTGLSAHDESRWKHLGPLATLLDAIPVVAFDLAPGESAELPALDGYEGPLGVVMSRQGGLTGPGAESALTLTLEIPAPEARHVLWQRSLDGAVDPAELQAISARLRLTGGNIQRAARLARAYAALAGRKAVNLADVQQAGRALNRQALETLAQRLEVGGDWEQLSVTADTHRELAGLESRCRHREHLQGGVGAVLGGQLNNGVRALFTGPSGTGKTLAARLLASVLQMDVYRIDLASVVNKYIGETEKNLSQVFARAEELDVILLLDEGDALLTQRTAVASSNDRYANLETNYLLQRIESFQGILIVTTNAGERIDGAFQRRMDVVVEFHLPEAAERWEIWQSHLPAGHKVDKAFLREVVNRCDLTGAQIRNIVLHASLLAIDADGGHLTRVCLEEAVRREYRKNGAVCPLSPTG